MLNPFKPIQQCQLYFDPYEKPWLSGVGQDRFVWAKEHNYRPSRGPSGVIEYINGAMGEFACSIALNLYWRPTVGDLKQRDCGGVVDVRTIVVNDHHLCVKRKQENCPVVLAKCVDSEKLHWTLCGWMHAIDIKRKYPLIRGNETTDDLYWVPQQDLHPMQELFMWLHSVGDLQFVEIIDRRF